MPAVPLGIEAYQRSASSLPETRLLNLYMEEDKSGVSPDGFVRLQRPGLTRTATLPSRIRALYQSDNTLSSAVVYVAGTQWGYFDGSPTVIGTVEDDGASARVAATFERIGVVSAGVFSIWDGTTVTVVKVRDKEDPNAPGLELTDPQPIIDIDVLNGYFILGTASGTFYWLVPGETTINPLNFATAEALPDGCRAVRRLRDDLFFFGSQSIEVWQASGDADATFTRVPGRLIDRGISAQESLAIFDNSLVWVGDDGIVYRMGDPPKRISTFAIEERIARATDLPSAWVLTTLGHKFYILTIPGEGTFAYDAASQLWCEFSWPAVTGLDTLRGSVAADAAGGLLNLVPTSSLDDGKPFLRLVTGTISVPPKPVANSSLALGVGTSAPASFGLRWNDGRRGWSSTVPLNSRGEADVLNAWRLGAARAPYRTFEISTVTPAVISIFGAVANEGWRV